MTDQSFELRWYLACEESIKRWRIKTEVAKDIQAAMDALWQNLTPAEREWINNRGELK